MEHVLDIASLHDAGSHLREWLETNALNKDTALQLFVAFVAFAVALIVAPIVRRGIIWIGSWHSGDAFLAKTSAALTALALPLAWLILQWVSSQIAKQLAWPHHLLTITVSLLTAWIVIRLASSLIRDPVMARLISTSAWVVAALNIVGFLDPTIAVLDGLALQSGGLRVSALAVIKGVVALGVLVWAAMLVARVTEKRISSLTNLTPSVQVLLAKLVKIVLVTVAVLVAVSSVGIDLTAFAVFGGALGVGVGLGLQKSVANLVSGVLILMDKSVKPGDVIEVGNTFGQVNSLGGRYTSVVTLAGIEHLIPNEELISQRVANWSFSSNEIRLSVPVGISYGSDVDKAIELCVEAAEETDRILSTPKPKSLVTGFGDSSVDLEVGFWINDPMKGTLNVRSELFLRIWRKFREHQIEIPFPQRDLHLKSTVPLQAAE